MVNQTLADDPGTDCLNEVKPVAPEVAGLLFSVYEDSEQLFKSTPGGAGSYMFRRTAADPDPGTADSSVSPCVQVLRQAEKGLNELESSGIPLLAKEGWLRQQE